MQIKRQNSFQFPHKIANKKKTREKLTKTTNARRNWWKKKKETHSDRLHKFASYFVGNLYAQPNDTRILIESK